MSDETVFYTDGFGVTITSENVIAGKKTYELSEIKSFRVNKYPKNRKSPTIITICGAILVTMNIIDSNIIRLVLGAFIFILGVYELISKPVYMIRILHAKGEYPILKTRDNTRVEEVKDALEAALTRRKRYEANADK